jgi:hypothetical protein
VDEPEVAASWQARSGKPFDRDLMARGPFFSLTWSKVPFSVYQQLRQWWRQYEKDFFTYADYDDSPLRYYTGKFQAEPKSERLANNQVNISAVFVTIPKLPQFQYPSNWGVDSIFFEERNGYGDDLIKYTGSGWTGNIAIAQAAAHNGVWSTSSTTNDIAELVYMGYGFRYWSPKASNLGIVEISLDGTVVGTVDLYNAATLNSGALFAQTNVVLGQHRVKIRCTGTKNASSSANTVAYDAIEVMR